MQSVTKRDKFEKMGQYVLICFNEEPLLPTVEGSELQYRYDTAKLPLGCARDVVIDTIVKIKYPTFDKEIAAILNGGIDSQEHSEWRVVAKLIADEFVVYRNSL